MKSRAALLFVLLLAGCGVGPDSETAIYIDGLRFSPGEFKQAYKDARFAEYRGMGHREFLDSFITRKLILLEAEKAGLDKDPEFLRDVQRFWEQALLKAMLERKSGELARDMEVPAREVDNFYRAHKSRDFAGKNLEEVREQIRWMLFKRKQNNAVEEWVDSLRGKAVIRVDDKKLNLDI